MNFEVVLGKKRRHSPAVIEDELLKLGVPKSDIIFGWLPEYARAYSGWGIDKAA